MDLLKIIPVELIHFLLAMIFTDKKSYLYLATGFLSIVVVNLVVIFII